QPRRPLDLQRAFREGELRLQLGGNRAHGGFRGSPGLSCCAFCSDLRRIRAVLIAHFSASTPGGISAATGGAAAALRGFGVSRLLISLAKPSMIACGLAGQPGM